MVYKGLYNHISQVEKTLIDYLLVFPQERLNLWPLEEKLKQGINIVNPSNQTSHLTAQGIIIDPINHRLLVDSQAKSSDHVIETDEDILASAIRIFQESFKNLNVDLHPWHIQKKIPFDIGISFSGVTEKELTHLHYEFRYLFMYIPTVQTHQLPKSAYWVPIQSLYQTKPTNQTKFRLLTIS